MIDATARLEHYADHLAPTWHALPAERRGTFWVPPALADHAARLGLEPTVYPGAAPPWDESPDPILVAATQDVRRAAPTGRPIAYQGHGVGQTFIDAQGNRIRGYTGGGGFESVRLFLAPNERAAGLWRDAYPAADVVVVGCPKLGGRSREDGPRGALVVAGFHWRCFPGDTLVAGPPVVGATARWFEGELIVIRTASGNELSCTPNHPVLTGAGWAAAGSLHEGDHLVRNDLGERVEDGVRPDEHHVPARIEDVARAAIESRAMLAVGVPVAAEDFHGDGGGSDVAVVAADRLLLDQPADPPAAHPFGEGRLVGVDLHLSPLARDGALAQGLLGHADQLPGLPELPHGGGSLVGAESLPAAAVDGARGRVLAGLAEPPHRDIDGHAERSPDRCGALAGAVERQNAVDVGAGDPARGDARLLECAPVLVTHGAHPLARDLGLGAQDADAAQVLGDLPPGLAEVLDELDDGGPGAVTLDEIVEVGRRQFEGHVYNLQTTGGWYEANGYIVHNCAIGIPEAGTAWDHYRPALPALARRFDFALHAHPRFRVPVRRAAARLRVPFIESFDEVLERAAVYLNDASSTLFEFAAYGGPVVVLNSPRFRRDVHHGLRFWDCADVGPNVEHPDGVVEAVTRALADPSETRARRREVCDELYPHRDAARRAAAAVMSLAHAPLEVAA